MEELEIKCKELREEQDILSELSTELNQAFEQVKADYMADIKKAVRAVADKRADIHNWVDGNRELFDKSRSQTLHGIRVGLQKGRGVVECDDEVKAIGWIQKNCTKSEVEVLVKRSERLNKPALNDIEASDLKAMGVRIVNTGDKIIIKDTDGEIEKLIASMLREKEKEALSDD